LRKVIATRAAASSIALRWRAAIVPHIGQADGQNRCV
jgi:hypothetical protein